VGTRRRELLQRRIDSATPAAVDTRATVRTFGHAPTIYWSVSPVNKTRLAGADYCPGFFGFFKTKANRNSSLNRVISILPVIYLSRLS